MTTYSSLHSAIVAKITSIKTAAKIQQIAGADLPAGEWPLVTVSPSDNENDYYTTESTMRGYGFNIKVKHVTNKEVLDLEDVDGVLMAVADAIIDAFDNDETLGGACHISQPVAGPFDFERAAVGEVRVVLLKLKCQVHKYLT